MADDTKLRKRLSARAEPERTGLSEPWEERDDDMPVAPKITVLAPIERLLMAAGAIADGELSAMHESQKNGDRVNVGAYSKLVDAVTKLAREEREQAKQLGDDDMDEESMVALAEQILRERGRLP
jgi:nitrogen fixation/metabolism regulation signal transduction histidine kinase